MKIGIIYGSSTGNTKKVGEIIKDELKNHQVQMINVADVKDGDYERHEVILYGVSTWNYGDLQTDFRRYIDEISPELIGNKQVAVFGCGDNWGFTSVFCKAVDTLEEKLRSCGVEPITEALKVDRKVEDNMEAIMAYGQHLDTLLKV